MIIVISFVTSILMLAWFLAINERQAKILSLLYKISDPNVRLAEEGFEKLRHATSLEERKRIVEQISYHFEKVSRDDKMLKKWVKDRKAEITKVI